MVAAQLARLAACGASAAAAEQTAADAAARLADGVSAGLCHTASLLAGFETALLECAAARQAAPSGCVAGAPPAPRHVPPPSAAASAGRGVRGKHGAPPHGLSVCLSFCLSVCRMCCASHVRGCNARGRTCIAADVCVSRDGCVGCSARPMRSAAGGEGAADVGAMPFARVWCAADARSPLVFSCLLRCALHLDERLRDPALARPAACSSGGGGFAGALRGALHRSVVLAGCGGAPQHFGTEACALCCAAALLARARGDLQVWLRLSV
jgi:hypothetical protein